MSLGFGIVLLVIGLWFFGGAIRAWPPGRYRSVYLHESKAGDFVLASLLICTLWGTGIPLILGVSWWWLVLVCGTVATILWSVVVGRARYGG